MSAMTGGQETTHERLICIVTRNFSQRMSGSVVQRDRCDQVVECELDAKRLLVELVVLGQNENDEEKERQQERDWTHGF